MSFPNLPAGMGWPFVDATTGEFQSEAVRGWLDARYGFIYDTGRAMDFNRNKPGERMLYRSNFDLGFDNWTDMWDGYRPLPPISLTDHAAHSGSRSLLLSTTEGTYVEGRHGNGNMAFRRMVRTRPDNPSPTSIDRFASFSAYIGLGIGGYNGSWDSFALLIDTNKYDDSFRNFFRLVCKWQQPEDGFTKWQIATDSNPANNIDIPGSTHIWQGDNDNKVNFGYVRLTIDRQANDGLGGYHEAQINTKVFDLTGLGAGTAEEPLQFVDYNIQQFNGGDNIGFLLSRSEAVGGCQLYADDITYSVRDQA